MKADILQRLEKESRRRELDGDPVVDLLQEAIVEIRDTREQLDRVLSAGERMLPKVERLLDQIIRTEVLDPVRWMKPANARRSKRDSRKRRGGQ